MKKSKIVVYVSGGCVQRIYSNNPRIEVELFDEDNITSEEEDKNQKNFDVTPMKIREIVSDKFAKATKGLKEIF